MAQFTLQLCGGHHGGLSGVVEFFQISHDGATQPTNAVVLTVGMKIGSEVGANGQF